MKRSKQPNALRARDDGLRRVRKLTWRAGLLAAAGATVAGARFAHLRTVRRGLPEIAAALERLAFGGTSGRAGARAVRDLHQLSGLVAERGACHLPDGVARLVASALRVFSDDVRRHERGPCAGARGRPVFPVAASEHAGSAN